MTAPEGAPPGAGEPEAERRGSRRLRLAVRGVAAAVVTLALVAVWGPSITPTAPVPVQVQVPHGQTARAAVRPNIVFILTDDLSMNLLPYLPHVRAMQRKGVTLSHYYVVDSLCCPSRTAIFTGEYPHDNGVFTNAGKDGGYAAYDAHGNEKKTFALAVQKAGYRTGFMGKYLNGYQPSDPVPPGWDTWAGVGNGYRGFNYDMNVDGVVQHYGSLPQDYLTDVLSRRAGRFIDDAGARGKPFMLEVATFAPHAPYVPAPRHAAAYPGLTYPQTPAYSRLPTGTPPWLARHVPVSSQNQLLIDQDFRKRVQSVLAVDELVGHIQTVLKQRELAGNTYIVFSSDNGYHMGEYQLLPGKQTAFDTDIHVPLVVTGPGVPHGRVVDQLASNIDLAPTFEKLADAPPPPTVDGVSLVPLWRGASPPLWQRAVLVEHHRPGRAGSDPDRQARPSGMPPSYEAVRTSNALYVVYADGEQEYYDTVRDPYELHNLAADGVPPLLVMQLNALRSCHGASQCPVAGRIG